MNVFTVSLFGHRWIEDLRKLEKNIKPIIKELLENNTYVNFLIGRNGDFDEYAASVIKTVRKDMGMENSEITLVLPYTVANIEYYEKYYDFIVIPEIVYGSHPKFSITARNRWMVENSQLVVAYVERKKGGAYEAVKYAEKTGVKIINLCDKLFPQDGRGV